jgi:hypothetical protein
MFMPQSQHHAHMPFAFRRDRHLQAVFSQSVPRFRRRRGQIVSARPTAWKLQWVMPFVPAMGEIRTGLAANEDECSPTLCEAPGELQLSFIGTLRAEKPNVKTLDGASHRLFVMKGPEINQLQSATRYSDEECYCGFARPDLAILASGVDGNARIVGRKAKTLKTSFQQLARISYCFDAPSKLLITGVRGPGSLPETILFDLDAVRILGELRVQGQPCYKPSLLSDLAVVPVPPFCKQGWRLSYGDHYEIRPTTIEAKAS